MYGRIECTVVTPEQTVLDQAVQFVAIPLFDGEIGIGTNHAPLIGRLGYGEMRLTIRDEVLRYYVDGGFVQVIDNHVSIMTPRAIAADELDVAAAEKQLREALKRKADSPERLAVRDRLVAQARGQLRVARRDGAG